MFHVEQSRGCENANVSFDVFAYIVPLRLITMETIPRNRISTAALPNKKDSPVIPDLLPVLCPSRYKAFQIPPKVPRGTFPPRLPTELRYASA